MIFQKVLVTQNAPRGVVQIFGNLAGSKEEVAVKTAASPMLGVDSGKTAFTLAYMQISACTPAAKM